MSLPCIVGARGVVQISKQPLGEWERESLQATATYFHENAEKLLKNNQPEQTQVNKTQQETEAHTETAEPETHNEIQSQAVEETINEPENY